MEANLSPLQTHPSALQTLFFDSEDEMDQDALNGIVVLAFQTAFLLTLGIVGFVANCLVFVVFYRRPALRSLSNRFVLSLVFANLLSTVSLVPVTFIQLFRSDVALTAWWRQFVCSLTALVVVASVLSVLLIAVDRYYAVISPLHYSMTITRHRSKFMILAVWCVSLLLSLPPLFLPLRVQPVRWPISSPCPTPVPPEEGILHLCYSVAMTLLAYVVPLVVLCWVYVRMYHAAHKNSERTRRHSLSTNPGEVVVDVVPGTPEVHSSQVKRSSKQSTHHRRRSSNASFSALFFREEGRAVKTAVMVVASFLICWTPYFATLLGETGLLAVHMPSLCRYFVLISALASSALSPFVYVYRNETASNEALKLVCFWRSNDQKPIEFPATPAKSNASVNGTPSRMWFEQETMSVHSFATECQRCGSLSLDCSNSEMEVNISNKPDVNSKPIRSFGHVIAARANGNCHTCLRQNSDSSDTSERPLLRESKRRLESLGSWKSSSCGSSSFELESMCPAAPPVRHPFIRASTVSIECPALNIGNRRKDIDIRETSLASSELAYSLDNVRAPQRLLLLRQDSGCSMDSNERGCTRQDSNFSDISQRTIDSGVVPDVTKHPGKRKHKLQRLRAVEDYDDILLEEVPGDCDDGSSSEDERRRRGGISNGSLKVHLPSAQQLVRKLSLSRKTAGSQSKDGMKARDISPGAVVAVDATKKTTAEITAKFKSSFKNKFQRTPIRAVDT